MTFAMRITQLYQGCYQDDLLHESLSRLSARTCRPSTGQAQEVMAAIQACRFRHYVSPRSEAASWRELSGPSALLMLKGVGNRDCQEQPDTLLSLEYKPVWFRRPVPPGSGGGNGSASATASRPVSVWRPVGPPGYVVLGDVAVMGLDSPPQPVRLYRDPLLGSDGDAPGGKHVTIALYTKLMSILGH
jgi:hypothetical protein